MLDDQYFTPPITLYAITTIATDELLITSGQQMTALAAFTRVMRQITVFEGQWS
jgi:hypothetical protein